MNVSLTEKDMQTYVVICNNCWCLVCCGVCGHMSRKIGMKMPKTRFKMDSDDKVVKISLQKIIEYCTLTTAAIFKIIPYYWNLK